MERRNVCTPSLRKGRTERERETPRERERRIRVQRADTVVKEPSSSLHLDTHKYKAQPFELPRRVSSFHLPPTPSTSLAPATLDSARLGSVPYPAGRANLFHVPAFSGPFTIFGRALASSTGRGGHRSPEDTALSPR